MHEWISDSNQTPHIVVDASLEGVEVPRQYVQGGKIILNVSSNIMGNTICPFGDAAAMPAAAFIKKYHEEFDEHIAEKRCTVSSSDGVLQHSDF